MGRVHTLLLDGDFPLVATIESAEISQIKNIFHAKVREIFIKCSHRKGNIHIFAAIDFIIHNVSRSSSLLEKKNPKANRLH